MARIFGEAFPQNILDLREGVERSKPLGTYPKISKICLARCTNCNNVRNRFIQVVVGALQPLRLEQVYKSLSLIPGVDCKKCKGVGTVVPISIKGYKYRESTESTEGITESTPKAREIRYKMIQRGLGRKFVAE